MSTRAPLFDSAFLAKLERLHLLVRRMFRGERRAERRARQTGASLEFADYREYTPGDEPRSIDWHAYGRLERLFVKLHEHEQDLAVTFLVDSSRSMSWQSDKTPDSPGKLDYARRFAPRSHTSRSPIWTGSPFIFSRRVPSRSWAWRAGNPRFIPC